MRLLNPRQARRFAVIGRIGDLVIVVSVVLRLARRNGWLSDDRATQMGLTNVPEPEPLAPVELAIAAAAMVRLLRSKKPRN